MPFAKNSSESWTYCH